MNMKEQNKLLPEYSEKEWRVIREIREWVASPIYVRIIPGLTAESVREFAEEVAGVPSAHPDYAARMDAAMALCKAKYSLGK